jgi:hypothetical protein
MKKMLLALLLLAASSSHAQLAVKAFQFRPTGELGQVANKAIAGELLFMENIKKKFFRTRAAIGYAKLTPRQDTIPLYGISNDNGGIVYPSYQVFHKLSIAYVSIGGDFRIVNKNPYFAYLGIEGMGFVLNEEMDSYSKYASRGGDESYGLIGYRARIGFEYLVNDHIGLFLEGTRAGYFSPLVGAIGHNDIGLGFHYNF